MSNSTPSAYTRRRQQQQQQQEEDHCNPILGHTVNQALKQAVQALDDMQKRSLEHRALYWSQQRAILKLLCRLSLTDEDIVILRDVSDRFNRGLFGNSLSYTVRQEVVHAINASTGVDRRPQPSTRPDPPWRPCANPFLGVRGRKLIKAEIIRQQSMTRNLES